MKTALYILFTLFHLLAINANSQNLIVLNNRFEQTNEAEINFGQKIVLKGEVDKKITEIKITVTDGAELKEETIQVTDGEWSHVIGPFLPNAAVSLFFESIEFVSEELKNKIKQSFVTSFDKMLEKIMRDNLSFGTDEEKLNFARGIIKAELPDDLSKFKNEADINARDFILDSLITDSDSIIKWFNHIQNFQKSEKEVIIGFSELKKRITEGGKKNLTEEEYKSLLNQFSDQKYFEKTFTSNKETIRSSVLQYDSTLKNRVNFLIKKMDIMLSSKKNIDSITNYFESKIESFSRTTFSSIQSTTKKFESELMEYAGFDASGLVFSKGETSAVGMFFTISPYVKKIGVDDEVNWRDLRTYITPTVGISVMMTKTTQDIKPMFFVGGSIRLNKLIRITTGDAFYINSTDNHIYHLWASGISLNINYLSDLLNIFNSISQTKTPKFNLE